METIIAATDFSKPANNAIEYAANLARVLNTKLVLVHAFSLPLGGYDVEAPLETIHDLRRNAEKNLKLTKDHLIGKSYDFGIEYYAELGSTYTVIEDVANKYSADLIVMGMTGAAGKIKEHVIGSSTLRVAKALSRPLLVISEHVRYRTIQKICLATEIKELEENTLIYSARDLARMFNAELEIVTVEKPDKEPVWENPGNYSFVESRLKNVKHKEVLIREENVAVALEYYFKFHETDMVIVNPKKHNVFQKLFSGSITKHLSFHIRVPLLVLH